MSWSGQIAQAVALESSPVLTMTVRSGPRTARPSPRRAWPRRPRRPARRRVASVSRSVRDDVGAADRKLIRGLPLEAFADQAFGLLGLVGVIAPAHRGDVGLGRWLVIDDAHAAGECRPSDTRPRRRRRKRDASDRARRFDGQRRPTALLMTISSPSTVYQTTAERGAPSGSIVAIVANRGSSRKVRTSSDRGRCRELAVIASGGVRLGHWPDGTRPSSWAAFSRGALRRDRDVEAVLGRRQRAGPSRVECARRLDAKLKSTMSVPRQVAAEVRALGGIHEVAAGGVVSVPFVASRNGMKRPPA